MEAKAEAKIEYKFVPCIFVGIGGSGSKIISTIREKITFRLDSEGVNKDNYMDKVFQFIVVDSANKGAGYFGVPENNYLNLGNFDGSEVVRLQEKENPKEFNKWWYSGYYPGFLLEGAGQIRVNGRLCLIQNMRQGGTTAVFAIQNACQRAMDLLTVGTAPTKAVKVYFFSSLCGGTGSGILMDLAVLARKTLSKSNPWIFNYLITPEVVARVAGAKAKNQLYANSYAFCKELSFWQDPKNSNKYGFRLMGVDFKLDDGEKAFDLVYIFSGRNADGKEIPSFETSHRLIADVVYMNAISPHTGKEISDAICNVISFYRQNSTVKHEKSGAERAISFGSGGVAHLKFPQEKICNFLAMGLIEHFVRTYIWQEPDATSLFNEFLKNRASLDVGGLEKGILEDVHLPNEPTGWREKVQEGRERDWEILCQEVEKAFEEYKGLLGKYLDAKEPLLLDRFKQALDGTLRNTLEIGSDPRRFGLVAQLIEKLEQELVGKVKKEEETKKAGLENRFVDQVEALSVELERMRKRELKEAKDNLDEAFSRSGILLWIKSRGIKDAKDRLESFYERLIVKEREYLIRSTLLRYFEQCLRVVEGRKRGIRFIRKGVLDRVMTRAQVEMVNLLTGREYDDDSGGIVIEILGDRDWILSSEYIKWYRKEAESGIMDDLAGILLTTDVGGGYLNVIKELNRVWEDFDRGVKENVLDQRMTELGVLTFSCHLRLCAIRFKERFMADEENRVKSIWDALVEEAKSKGFQGKDQIRRHILDRLGDLRNKAVPFWDLSSVTMTQFVNKDLKKDIVTFSYSNDAFQKFGKEYNYKTIGDLFGLDLSGFTGIESRDPWGLTLVKLDYGAPLFALNPTEQYGGYHEQYEGHKALNIPLHVDKRYDDPHDRTFGVPDLPFPEKYEADRLMFLLAEWFGPKKEIMKTIAPDGKEIQTTNYLVVSVENTSVRKRGDKDAKGTDKAFITHTTAGQYILEDGRGHREGVKGRDRAEAEFPSTEAFKNVQVQISEYWRAHLTPSQRCQKLIQIKSFMEDWLKTTQKTKPGEATPRAVRKQIDQDIGVLNEKIDMGGEYLV